jgi:HAD superfamily hydrolase (TIGR01509 family)
VNCELVIFDCDGVLVDSEPISNRVFTAALHDLGFDWTYEEVCKRFIGLSMPRCIELVEEDLGRPVPDRFVAELQRRTFEAFREDGLQPVRGVPQLLDSLEVPFCVASGGEVEKMRNTLGLTGLLPRFEGRMFSAQQVRHGKPAPDLFLFAAAACGVPPGRCAVVEDSVPGVRAAAAAGMTVFGYAERTDRDALQAHGAVVFESMADLPRLVREQPVAKEGPGECAGHGT